MEAWNSGVITTWGEPLFGPVPRQPSNNATRHKPCRALQLTQLTSLTIPATASGDTMFFIYISIRILLYIVLRTAWSLRYTVIS
jgi:hypothetical protein